MLARSLLDRIGNTPLVRVLGIGVKLEYLNPTGSIKDRVAKFIIEKAEQTNQLRRGMRIVEASSGNTGIAFAFVSALKKYPCTIVLPRGFSPERAEMIRAFGAQVVFVHKNCVQCAVNKTHSFKNAFLPRQFENPWNVQENEKILGKEILLQLPKKIDCIVAGVGTGGTLIGVGKAVRKKFPRARLVAVEPSECPLLSLNRFGTHGISGLHKGFTCKQHGIEGIGDGFVPKIVEQNRGLVDEVIRIRTQDALGMTQRLARMGFLVGPSSGANLLAALKMKKKGFRNVVTFFCDRGERYLSEKIFD